MVPLREDGRRCLSLGELSGGGFVRNERGRWEFAVRAARARVAFGHRAGGVVGVDVGVAA